MQKLHLVGFTTDHEGLILSARRGARSGGYLLVIDASVEEAVDELRAKRAEEADEETEAQQRRAPRVESALSVREIQARLRQGRTVAEVARAAGVDADWVDRFAVPVLAERAQVIARVRSMPLRRARLGPSRLPIGESIRQQLADRGVSFTPEEFAAAWTTRQVSDGRWVVRFSYRYRGRDQALAYELHEATGEVSAADRLSGQLGYVTPPTPSSPAPAPARTAPKAVEERPRAKRAVVSTGFRPDAPAKSAVSRSAKEREKAAAAMRKAAVKRAAEAEKAAARRTREKAAEAARREREERAAAAAAERKAREEKAAADARRAEKAAAAKIAAAKRRAAASKPAPAKKAPAAPAKAVTPKAAPAKSAPTKSAPTKSPAKRTVSTKPSAVEASSSRAARPRPPTIPAAVAVVPQLPSTAPVRRQPPVVSGGPERRPTEVAPAPAPVAPAPVAPAPVAPAPVAPAPVAPAPVAPTPAPWISGDPVRHSPRPDLAPSRAAGREPAPERRPPADATRVQFRPGAAEPVGDGAVRREPPSATPAGGPPPNGAAQGPARPPLNRPRRTRPLRAT